MAKRDLFAGMIRLIEEASELSAPWNKLLSKHLEGDLTDEEGAALLDQVLSEFGDLEAQIKYVRAHLPGAFKRTINQHRDERVKRHKKRVFAGLPQKREPKKGKH